MKNIDPESKALWEDLRRAGTTNQAELDRLAGAIDNTAALPCCEAMGKLKKMGWVVFNIPTSLHKCERVKILYCPECGRKLE